MLSKISVVATFATIVASFLIVVAIANALHHSPASAQSVDVPDTPARPTVSNATHNSVTISWADPDDASITGYQILRRNRATDAVGSFTVIENDTGDANTTYTDTSVAASSRYVYRVKARNGNGLSQRSRYRRADTTAAPPIEQAATPTPTPTPEPTSTPTATPTPEPTSTPTPTPIPAEQQPLVQSGTITENGPQEPLIAQPQIEDDFSADTSTTGTVVVGGTSTGGGATFGDIEIATDRDWFAVILTAGKTYRFDLMGSITGDGTLLDPFLAGVRDSSGNLIHNSSDNDGGAQFNSRKSLAIPTTGTYYVVAAGYGTGTYSVKVLEVTGGRIDDFSADTSTSGTLAVNGSAIGAVEFLNDRDWFKINLTSGKTYRFDQFGSGVTYGSGDIKGTLDDNYIHGIYNSSGQLISGTSDNRQGHWWTGRVVFTPTSTGDYYVSSGNFSDIPREGTYLLTATDVTTGQTDDYTASSTTPGSVTVGTPVKVRIEQDDDRDWYSVTLTANKVYRFQLQGIWTGDGIAENPYLHAIRNSSGVKISDSEDDDSGYVLNALEFFTPSATGTYYIDVGSKDAGTFTLTVTNITDDHQDQYTGDVSTTGTVGIGGSVTGDVGHPGDQDWFAVQLVANTAYTIDLKGTVTGDGSPGFGTLFDPYIHGIHNSSGTLINGTTDDDGGKHNYSRVRFTPTTSGKYFIAAGGDSGTYTLFVSE